MSWWISLEDKKTGGALDVSNFADGGTYVLGGSTVADLNVTYNYGKHFKFKNLHKQRAGNTIKELEFAVKALGTKKDTDYWNPTEGNVGHTVNILLGWAKKHPSGIWNVS